jgi:hypothetical protein
MIFRILFSYYLIQQAALNTNTKIDNWAEFTKFDYSYQMHLCHIRLTVYALALLGLCACERDTYTTWSCNSQTETKISMILRKAQMEWKDLKLDYCGSLGNQSYFDQKCPALTQDSKYVFTPSSGILKTGTQDYQCAAL